jgi:hypothetical protein
VHYLRFLKGIHRALQPPTYLEIGIRNGGSLALSRSRSVGVDPAYNVRAELACPVELHRTTSDEFFERPEPLGHFGGEPAALSFIDGMHLFEYVLRDFVNVERHSAWWSVTVFDDILPRTTDEANRERSTQSWTGDVFKIIPVLERERPDLLCLRVGTQPTGLLLVLGSDPADEHLAARVAALTEEWVVPDPQDVPDDLLQRDGVLDPQAVLEAPFWGLLRSAREERTHKDQGLPALRRSIRRSFPELRRGPLQQAAGLLHRG